MKCAIMQPTYLPWAGYMAMMRAVDVFVFLDDVQFERRSWQSRNRIVLNGREKMLTVPVRLVARGTTLMDIELDDTQDWRRTHLATLRHAYARAPYGKEALQIVENALAVPTSRLCDLTILLIEHLNATLGTSVVTQRASALGCGGRRSEHLAQIARAVGCDEYLSPLGSRDYLLEDDFERRSGLNLIFHEFDCPPYDQPGAEEFMSHMSIVDVLANLGPKQTIAYLRGE